MAKEKDNIIVMSPERDGMRIGSVCIGVLWFCALFLLLVPRPHTACAAAVTTGAAVVAVLLLFGNDKRVRIGVFVALVAYTALAVSAGFGAFCDGAATYWNKFAFAVNTAAHRGFASVRVDATEGGCFLFLSVVSAWLGLGVAAIEKRSCPAALFVGVALLLALLFLGLIPAYYVVAWWAISAIGLLLVVRKFSGKAAVCCLAAAAVLFGAVAPCFLYGGSRQVRNFRAELVRAFEHTLYGADGLPEGRLAEAGAMCASDEVRLNVTLTQDVSTLYLKGFVGGSLDGNVWKETDRNAYEAGDRGGLLDYLAAENVPFGQIAAYKQLDNAPDKYPVTVENVSASRKYVYAPYAAQSVGVGAPYYDLQVRGGVFSKRTYSFEVRGGDGDCERTTQADWLTDAADRTPEMTAYLERERNYRAFVYDVYTETDGDVRETVLGAVGDRDAPSINTATHIVRAYFLDRYRFDEQVDGIGDDFVTAFFEGDVRRANAAYFATAATVIFRSYGFAARYVEGYLVRAGAATEQVTVTGRDAHAWTEVYFDGIGWLPIEVTPTFFSDETPDVTVDPIDPNDPEIDTPVTDPDVPTVDFDTPETPVDPVIEPQPAPQDPPPRLLTVLRVLVPIVAVPTAVALVVLAVVVRREYIVRKKRKALVGETVGRVAYGIVTDDCKPFGGFDADVLADRGVDRAHTARFMRLVERNVYGGYALNDYERRCVEEYIESVATALTHGAGRLGRLYCKYIRCVGL